MLGKYILRMNDSDMVFHFHFRFVFCLFFFCLGSHRHCEAHVRDAANGEATMSELHGCAEDDAAALRLHVRSSGHCVLSGGRGSGHQCPGQGASLSVTAGGIS